VDGTSANRCMPRVFFMMPFSGFIALFCYIFAVTLMKLLFINDELPMIIVPEP
jgi:hypothetical protein